MKKITPLQINQMDDSQLAILSGITGKPVFCQNLPFLGRTVCYDGCRHTKLLENLPSNDFFEVALEQRCETSEVVRFYIGSKKHGPVLTVEIRDDGCEWYNCYAKNPGGWGKNCTHGGTWMGQSRHEPFATWKEALCNRYNPSLVLGGEAGVKRIKFTEGEVFKEELYSFLDLHC